jgi:peroxiredoxin-like protein
MLERSKINKDSLTMTSEGVVDISNGVITYKKIIHRPHLILHSEKDMGLAQKLARKAESSCMISRALKGNVEIELEENIEVK